MAKFFGTPEGIRVNQQFIDRAALSATYVHRPTQGGIHGNRAEGADSVVLSGGYPEDEDHGDYIIYTGHGGRNRNSSAQDRDQSFDDPGNAGLITSRTLGLPVRVIRGARLNSAFSPPSGYVYGGLFEVSAFWTILNKNGFRLIQFKLDRLPEQPPLISSTPPEIDPAYTQTVISRRIRDTSLSRAIKKIYRDKCQVCATAIPGFGERQYSEGAHVRPLGRPHLGADVFENLLCLCPNHHTELDLGGMVILDDFSVAHTSNMRPFADLTFASSHALQAENVRYQRDFWLRV